MYMHVPVCACTSTHFISNRIKDEVQEDGLERVKEDFVEKATLKLGFER